MRISAKRKSHLLLVVAFATVSTVAGCVFQRPGVKALDLAKSPVSVKSPVKAHLVDGTTIVYPDGVLLTNGFLVGSGSRYALGSTSSSGPTTIVIDSVIGMEAYDTKINVAASLVASTAGLIGGAAGSALLAIAIFGSCPTFYADSGGVELLQGEGFSYSVAPLLEQRDVDRLRVVELNGRITLHVRNEALETHYINHIEIVETIHDKAESVFPDQEGKPVAVSNVAPVELVSDRAGRNLSSVVRDADKVVFSTHPSVLDNATASDLDDRIEMVIPAPEGTDSVAVIMDMRNSLLNTVLLYDYILAAPGLKSLDFLGKDLQNISSAVEMAKWYSSHMGMRISVLDGSSWRQVARIGDSGPIAYHQVAIMVPAIRNGGKTVRVRLSFVADDWRIDAIRTSASWRRPITRSVPATRVAMHDPAQNKAALASLSEPDEGYVITSPGNSFRVEFDVGEAPQSRTFMLASQGYYTEWVRGSWIKHASGKPFVPSAATLLEAMRTWRVKQGDMEQRFFASRIATR